MRPRESRLWETVSSVALVLFVLVIGLPGSARARETSFWTTEKASDFLSGTPECVSIRQSDVVSLALELDTLVTGDENYLWCVTRDAKGNLYAGSGDGGNVYKFDVRGKTSLLLDSPELEVLSVAVDKSGAVYAGTSPGGLVYKIDTDGKSSVFFRTGESYVWCLVFDEKGNLYAGTGDHGRVYKIRPDGKGEVFYETGESHVMCAAYAGGKLIVGTEGSGLVISISAQGSGQVLYDCDEKEVRDLAVNGEGVVYAAAVSQTRRVLAQQTDSAADDAASGTEEQKKLVSTIYKIWEDGTGLKLWTTPRWSIYSLYLAGEDSLIVGTGDEGTIYGLANGKVELLEKVADSQILDVTGGDGALVFSTGNRGRVYSAGPSLCREGTLVSSAFDAAGVSRCGSLTWEAQVPPGTSLAFSVRSGNSEKPDKTWNEWGEALSSPGEAAKALPGRFLQWKAVLRSTGGRLSPSFRKVTLSYLEKNMAPVLASVQVIPQNVTFSTGSMDKVPERVSQTLPGGIKVEYSLTSDDQERNPEDATWARTFRTALWQASDPNSDRLTFSVFCRGTDEANWRVLAKDSKETIFTWNTASFADGTYLLRVVATDLPDNTPSEALTAEAVSLPFQIDNTPPVLSGLRYTKEKAGVRIEGIVSDNMSPIVGLDYSLDGGEWRNLQSADGLLDSAREEFSFVLDEGTRGQAIGPGEHTVLVRARDNAQNIGTGKVNLVLPAAR